MLKDDCYQPTDEDRQFSQRLIATIHRDPDRLATAGAALDRDYCTQAIRNRQAAELRRHRANPNHSKRSRAFERKHYPYDQMAQQLGFPLTPVEAVPPPPIRAKGPDGKPLRPTITLRKRFDTAFQETFKDETALNVPSSERRLEVASRRFLLAWLRLDPDRGSAKRITKFHRGIYLTQPTTTPCG